VQDADKVPEIAVVLDNLMSDPLALFNGFWACTQCHKVTLDNVFGILGVEPQRKRTRKVIGRDKIVTAHGAAGIVHANSLRERRGAGQRRNLGSQASCRLVPLGWQLWRRRLTGGRTSWALLRTTASLTGTASETSVADDCQ
jgi:hypothetical protein